MAGPAQPPDLFLHSPTINVLSPLQALPYVRDTLKLFEETIIYLFTPVSRQANSENTNTCAAKLSSLSNVEPSYGTTIHITHRRSFLPYNPLCLKRRGGEHSPF